MDPITIGGMGLSLVCILIAMIMEGSSPMSIVLPAPMILVIGGTIGAGLAGTRMPDLKLIIAGTIKAIKGQVADPGVVIEEIVSLAERARREGLLALEDAVSGIQEPFLQQGLQSAIDGTDPEDLHNILLDKVDAKRAEDKIAAKFYGNMGGLAPTLGIIGTVVSLVHVLGNLSDPGSLGPMIAGAFVATLWGLLTANLIYLPMSSRLGRLSETEIGTMNIIIEGITAIQSGANPRVVQQRLASLVPPSVAEAEAKKAA